MSTDRPIGLNLGMPGSGFDTAAGTDAGQPRQDASTEHGAARLRELMAAPAPGSPVAPGGVPRPFDLFGGAPLAGTGALALPAATPAQGHAPDTHAVGEALSRMASRLLVDDGGNGRRAVQIQLADDSLPGVTLDLSEDEGALLACFTCSNEASRERLARAADWLAGNLASSLGRDVRLRVMADDPEDPCTVETFISAGLASSTTSSASGPLR